MTELRTSIDLSQLPEGWTLERAQRHLDAAVLVAFQSAVLSQDPDVMGETMSRTEWQHVLLETAGDDDQLRRVMGTLADAVWPIGGQPREATVTVVQPRQEGRRRLVVELDVQGDEGDPEAALRSLLGRPWSRLGGGPWTTHHDGLRAELVGVRWEESTIG